jgi:hypothetical protein
MAFVVGGVAAAVVFIGIGTVTGWLNVHDSSGPDWLRATYLVTAICTTPALAFLAASRAWRSGR